GWRAGWWHFRFAFFWLMPASAYLAVGATIVSLVAIAAGWTRLGARGLAIAGLGLVLGAVLVYVPWQYDHARKTLPGIHDITTDTDNPPSHAAVLPARAAQKANSVNHEGPDLARQQKAAYPDLTPVELPLPQDQAFRRALDAAKAMPRWTIVAADPAQGRIEASEASRWFGFVDDIAIRVAGDAAGSHVDVRSVSRLGRSDFGVNARRIRAYVEALKRQG